MRNLFHFSDYNFAGICAFLFFFLHLVCSVCAMNYAFLCRCCCFWLLLLYDSISPIAMYDCTKHAFQLLLKKHIDLFRKIAVSLDSININPFGFDLRLVVAFHRRCFVVVFVVVVFVSVLFSPGKMLITSIEMLTNSK